MKLELKHIAPYLPYEPKIYDIGTRKIFHHVNLEVVQWLLEGDKINTKSLLKLALLPLSDLSKAELFDNYGNKKLTGVEEFEGNWDLSPLDWVLLEVSKGKQIERLLELNYLVIEELIRHHFDVFGLIDSGLAIDINTINK